MAKAKSIVKKRGFTQATVELLKHKADLLFERGIDLDSRKFTISGIDDGLFEYVSNCLTILEGQNASPITIELSSFGGDTYEALAIVGRIRSCRCKVNVVVYGKCMSAATLILASATGKRQMAKTSWFMYHEANGGAFGRHSEMRDQIVQQEREERQWDKWMGQYTKRPESFWTELSNSRKDWYYTPDECMSMGIIDAII